MSSDDERELTRLWRSFKTVKEMTRDRGYNILQNEIDVPLDEFRAQYCNAAGQVQRNMMSFQATPTPEFSEKFPQMGALWVEFCPEASVNIKTMRQFCLHIEEKNFTTGIFIYQESLTPSATKIIPTVAPRIIETFQESDLIVNIMKHKLVPKHITLSDPEKQELLERYRLKQSQLPRILKDDPVARYLGLKRGQVVKIIRRSETAGRYASYRICL